MKKIILALSLSFVLANNSFASCENAYSTKVAKMNHSQVNNIVGTLSWTTGGVLAFTLPAASLVSSFTVLGVVTIPLAVLYFATEANHHNYEHAAAMINNSYNIDQGVSKDLIEESVRLSRQLKREITPEDLATAIVELDKDNQFCTDGKPASLNKFRKVLKKELAEELLDEQPTAPQI